MPDLLAVTDPRCRSLTRLQGGRGGLQPAQLRAPAGPGLTTIANGLNADGVPTGQGGACWYPSTVRAVLGYAVRPG